MPLELAVGPMTLGPEALAIGIKKLALAFGPLLEWEGARSLEGKKPLLIEDLRLVAIQVRHLKEQVFVQVLTPLFVERSTP